MSEAFFWFEPGGVFNLLGSTIGFNGINGEASLTLLAGGTGLEMPPVRRTHEAVAGVAGTRLRVVEHDMRTVDLAVMLEGSSDAQLRTEMRAWRQRFDPKRGDSQLWCLSSDGYFTALTCRYAEGLDKVIQGQSADQNEGVQLAVVTLEADDPYWYDIGEIFASWTLGGAIPKWFDPGTSKAILPIQLAASSVVGRQILDNDGEVDAWPRWTISGPGSAISVQNNTTGRVFTWSQTLGDEDQLVIDTFPGVKTVELNGDWAFGALTKYDLWPLVKGPNDVTVTVADATTDSRVDVSFRRGWLGR